MPASALPILVSGVVPALVNAEEPARSLPMPPVAFGIIAFCAFLVGLGVLWTFRNTANKVPPRGGHNDDEFHG